MILEKETFKKFGYYPSGLKSSSRKKIITRCPKCSNIREAENRAYLISKYKVCQACSSSINGIKQRKVGILNEFTINEKLIDILFSGSVVYSKNFNIEIFARRKMRIVDTIKVLDLLNIKNEILTTQNLKDKILKYFLNKTNIEIFEIFTIILNKRNSLKRYKYKSGVGITYNICDKRNYIRKFLDKLNIEYTFNSGNCYIKKGSFYINNQWTHIDKE